MMTYFNKFYKSNTNIYNITKNIEKKIVSYIFLKYYYDLNQCAKINSLIKISREYIMIQTILLSQNFKSNTTNPSKYIS